MKLLSSLIHKLRIRRSLKNSSEKCLFTLCFVILVCVSLSFYSTERAEGSIFMVSTRHNRKPLQEEYKQLLTKLPSSKPSTRKPTKKTTKKPKPKPKLKPTSKPDDYEFRDVCSTSSEISGLYKKFYAEKNASLPVIFVITPTYERTEMAAELTRLGQTLLLVPNLHWILAEDSLKCSEAVHDLLNTLGLPYTHLISPMPKRYFNSKAKPKGVSNRRAALQWIKEHGNDKDVFYFLDDDNTVNIKLFDEIRFTKKISMFPVGLIGGYRVSSPIVKKDKVVGFYDSWIGGRKYAVDMGGFAVNVGYFRKQKNVKMPYSAGYEEDGFLKSLNIALTDIVPLADGCTTILVWHTKTTKNKIISIDTSNRTDDNVKQLLRNMIKMAVIK